MDFLEAGFRAKYEKVCVGNLAAEDEDVFFEGLLCEEGLGEFCYFYFLFLFFLFFGIFGSFDCFVFFIFLLFLLPFSLPCSLLFFLSLFFSFQSVRRGSADQTMGFGF